MAYGRRWLLRLAGAAAIQALLTACTPGRDHAPQRPTATAVPTIDLRPGGPSIAGPTSAASLLGRLRPGFPRLLLADDLDRIRHAIKEDPVAQRYYEAVVRASEQLLSSPPAERTLINGRLLATSQLVLSRIETLTLLAQLDSSPRWGERAVAELLAVAAFTDWNPAHFLDVAELLHAFAIGYDLLQAQLTPTDQATIRGALVELGLRPAERAYRTNASWLAARHNWNVVCNAGVIIGALAVAEDEPDLSGYLLGRALASLPAGLASYAPDGAWAEGPEYWGYATGYAAAALTALQNALGSDYAFSNRAGLAQTGHYRLHVTGPTGAVFNHADAAERLGGEPTLFWLARRYGAPALAHAARMATGSTGSARDLLWYAHEGTADDLRQVARDSHSQGVQLATFRTAWDDPQALFVAFKGGDNSADHVHLDAGTFVLDARGQRWACDLGADDRDLPGYFDSARWSYYRTRTIGHNTVTIAGQDQRPAGVAPLIVFAPDPSAHAIADLTAVYAHLGVTRFWRGIALLDGRSRVLIQDEISAARPFEALWALHTRAAVSIAPDGALAVLTLGEERLHARLLAPSAARFASEPVRLPEPQLPTDGITKLTIRLANDQPTTLIAVLLTPGDEITPPSLLPLDRWAQLGSG